MNAIIAAFGMGGTEMLVILAVILVLFGGKKIPELAKGLGTGIKEFKKAQREVTDELHRAAESDQTPRTPSPQPKIPANSEASTSSTTPGAQPRA